MNTEQTSKNIFMYVSLVLDILWSSGPCGVSRNGGLLNRVQRKSLGQCVNWSLQFLCMGTGPILEK